MQAGGRHTHLAPLVACAALHPVGLQRGGLARNILAGLLGKRESGRLLQCLLLLRVNAAGRGRNGIDDGRVIRAMKKIWAD